MSPSPPVQSPDVAGLDLLDLNDNPQQQQQQQRQNNGNQSGQPQVENMLGIATSPVAQNNVNGFNQQQFNMNGNQQQQQAEINYHKQQIQYQQHQQIPDLLSIPPPTGNNNGNNKHVNIVNNNQNNHNMNNQPKPRRSRKGNHRYTRSDAAVLIAKQKALKYWQCSVCTFAENPIEYPVCKVCSALPPERPPSPNPPLARLPDHMNQPPQRSLYNQQQDALRRLSNSHKNSNPNQQPSNITDEEETDPLGHQKSVSITKFPIMDDSISHKSNSQNNGNNNALIDFGFEDSNKSQGSENRPININNNVNAAHPQFMASNNSNSLQKPQIPQNPVNPSLMQSKGGVGFHQASKSGQNIIRGLQPYEVPDLPPEQPSDSLSMSSTNSKNNKNGGKKSAPQKNTIANLGVDVNAANDNKSGGFGGFFGKVYNGWNQRRARAQSNDGLASPPSNGSRSRSKSPRWNKRGKNKDSSASGSQANSSKRNISVATMPKKQQEKIAKRLGGLHTKKDLMKELDSSMNKLQKKLKQHANKVMTLKGEINVMEQDRNKELKQWNSWYVLELVDLAKDYYEHRLSWLNLQIELEKLHIECFTEKLQRLENASKNIKRNGKKWNVDDIRNNIEVAFHTAWRIRLSQDVPDKQDYVKQLSRIVESLKNSYDIKKTTLGTEEISIETRKEKVFLFLQSTV